ncbi:GNAT family N-acetyltransferase [Nocardioides sp.]|uniref:GNAT family N-acetyltransferase n=1 Tax=Nocardioides sp. TaxID=35761 RepID=UPI002B817932|nr:GNAT family N-acetyltransferase [Nocardioides sp.]HSX68364.1 GNAT family N-acetyltransferase [Nocardioides sp.]
MNPSADRPEASPASSAGVRLALAADAAAIAALDVELFPDAAWSEAQVLEELSGYGRRGWVVVPAQSGLRPDAGSTRVEPTREVPAGAPSGPGDAEAVALLHERSLSGYVLMRTVGEVSDLQRIGVAPSRQRAGLAAALLAAAIAGVREEGAERILLEVAEDNAAARAFYARAGFVEIDRRPRYYRHEVDALVLEKVLGDGG